MRFSGKARGASLVTLATVVASALGSAPQAGATVQAGAAALADRGTVTNYGMKASAFGTRVKGGDVSANSGRSAWAYLGCTKLTGVGRDNHLAGIRPGDTGDVEGIDSRVRTYRRDGAVHSRAVNKIASAEFSNGSDSLKVNGIKAVAQTWHDDRGFHRSGHSSIASLTLNGQALPVPSEEGQVVEAPGLAKLTFFSDRGRARKHSAKAVVRTVKVELIPSGTVVLLGNTFAQIQDDVPTGILAGQGRAADGSAFDGTVTTGKVPVQPLSCDGTDGEWVTNSTADVDIAGVAHLEALSASARGDQRDRSHGYGTTRGRVGRATLATPAGELVIEGVLGQANVRRDGGKLVRNIKGTRLGSITLNGEMQPLPTPGEPLVIAGVVKVSAPVVDKTRYGIKMIATPVTVFPGTDDQVQLNLGRARAKLKPH
jgi:hypothetical protein